MEWDDYATRIWECATLGVSLNAACSCAADSIGAGWIFLALARQKPWTSGLAQCRADKHDGEIVHSIHDGEEMKKEQ
jgi:hypothetical protein